MSQCSDETTFHSQNQIERDSHSQTGRETFVLRLGVPIQKPITKRVSWKDDSLKKCPCCNCLFGTCDLLATHVKHRHPEYRGSLSSDDGVAERTKSVKIEGASVSSVINDFPESTNQVYPSYRELLTHVLTYHPNLKENFDQYCKDYPDNFGGIPKTFDQGGSHGEIIAPNGPFPCPCPYCTSKRSNMYRNMSDHDTHTPNYENHNMEHSDLHSQDVLPNHSALNRAMEILTNTVTEQIACVQGAENALQLAETAVKNAETVFRSAATALECAKTAFQAARTAFQKMKAALQTIRTNSQRTRVVSETAAGTTRNNARTNLRRTSVVSETTTESSPKSARTDTGSTPQNTRTNSQSPRTAPKSGGVTPKSVTAANVGRDVPVFTKCTRRRINESEDRFNFASERNESPVPARILVTHSKPDAVASASSPTFDKRSSSETRSDAEVKKRRLGQGSSRRKTKTRRKQTIPKSLPFGRISSQLAATIEETTETTAMYHCPYCKYFVRATNDETLLEHVKFVHKDLKGPQLCQYCGRRCRKPPELFVHIRTHEEEKPFSCDICERRFRHYYQKKQHALSQKLSKCPNCVRIFCSRKQVTDHVPVCHVSNIRYSLATFPL